MMGAVFAVLALCSLTACRQTTNLQQKPTLTVSAAADLTPAFQALGKQFEEETKIKINFNFGSTGQLTQQIEQGAPVDLFAAANVSFIEELEM
jgi:molybdate transport system substrate-binding protein